MPVFYDCVICKTISTWSICQFAYIQGLPGDGGVGRGERDELVLLEMFIASGVFGILIFSVLQITRDVLKISS